MKRIVVAAAALLILSSHVSHAVTLNVDDLGEALLFPYYTVRSTKGNPYNTYVSVANHTTSAKALRVRIREGRNSREVAAFNLFLSPNDVWAAAFVPTATGARLITVDRSCVSPQFNGAPGEVPGVEFTNAGYIGDGNGDELDRTREGWIEIVEMATLTGASALAVTHAASAGSTPSNCGAVQGTAPVDVASPTGGISGTLTILNVASGLDFTVNAVALSDLSSGSYYRPADDPYPGFGANEIRPVSVVTANGFIYRSEWSRGVDAVSAVLMRSAWYGEFILDSGTISATDFVTIFPTRHHYVVGGTAVAPFSASCDFPRNDTYAGEPIEIVGFNREEFGGGISGFNPFPVAKNFRCGPATVVDFHNASTHTAFTDETSVLGSTNRGLAEAGMVSVGSSPNGWAGFRVTSGATLNSLPSSSRTNMETAATTFGSHRFAGLPVIGFSVRTFLNGTLTCGSASCQANYGGAFPFRFTRSISQAN